MSIISVFFVSSTPSLKNLWVHHCDGGIKKLRNVIYERTLKQVKLVQIRDSQST